MIWKSNFKTIIEYDIIIPKANKAEEFAPIIDIAEKELELCEEDEAEKNGMTETEYKRFLAEIYQ